ncbi:hypothetical protein [Nonomuraea sp. bgisy101]|uniref:hypothetical protein n=1 Tax=Nonomuraea sp. bgisy101 TaxID=3413784 RepID=UPI003D73032C
MSSATCAAAPRSWVMTSTALPSSHSSRSTAMVRSTSGLSRPLVGSSAISRPGSPARAIALAARCAIPPDSSCG